MAIYIYTHTYVIYTLSIYVKVYIVIYCKYVCISMYTYVLYKSVYTCVFTNFKIQIEHIDKETKAYSSKIIHKVNTSS